MHTNKRWYFLGCWGGWYKLDQDRLFFKPLLSFLSRNKQVYELQWEQLLIRPGLTDQEREEIEELRDIEDFLRDRP